MAKHVKRSVAPIYLIGVTWLIYAMFLPLSSGMDYLFCTVASIVVFIVAKNLFPDREYIVKEEASQTGNKEKAKSQPEKPKTTGNKEIDALIKERERAISEMRRLNDSIEDEKISDQIDHLEAVTGKIIDHVVEHPKKLPQIRRFLDYYLPTTLKLLNAYDRMDSAGIAGENITATKAKVEKMMDTITVAFDKQLDGLFGEEALDISTDITVMENLLAREGLNGMSFQNQSKNDDDSIQLEL